MKETTLIKKSREYAEKVISELETKYAYHNLEHTKDVVNAAEEIGEKSNLGHEDLENVIIASWFHDTGYSCGYEDHEDESVIIMKKKLSEWKVAPEKIYEIGRIIESTKMPQTPRDLPSQVMCDADLYHLSTKDFIERSELLRVELTENCKKDLPKAKWKEVTSQFMAEHKYFTNYGQTILEPRKNKNITKIKKEGKPKVKKEDKKYVKQLEKEIVKLKNKLDKTKEMKPDRGIETMFRVTSKNHLTLSGMADNKANIMISINSIILSVLVSVLFRKFEEYPNLIIPALMLVTVCLTTIVFAVLATRPNVSSGKFKREDIINKKTNLLFFGNFHSMELDNYMWGMKEMMKDADYLYGSLTKDIYFLGKVLGKKYKMLRKSYTIFMFGFVISIIAFIIAMLFFPAQG
ncbi:Pycsar system effector family protein [Fulvivirga aurantia]|uniref:Pycsar system effector family protein n=1 Tax=Fulvivirga aurantia TaxID=2529383 RepID=UPI001FE302DB|nr:Pycsar system effector family protein [Fulvivirga aurantia]